MQRVDLDDADNFETVIMPDGSKREVLRDGRRMRVRMTDSRPGWRTPTKMGDAEAKRAADAKAAAYDAYDAETSAAWQNSPTSFGSHEFSSATTGRESAADARRVVSTSDAAAIKGQAYRDYDAALAAAWMRG